MFDQIQAAEKAGSLSPEEKKKLEEQAAEKGLQALFKVRFLPSNEATLFVSAITEAILLDCRVRSLRSNPSYERLAIVS